MYAQRILGCLVVAGLIWAFNPVNRDEGQAHGTSYPYYTQWYYNTDSNYYYCNYNYAPGTDYYHRCYYYPTSYYPQWYGGRQYVYYQNWRTRHYWGRMDLKTGMYSLLPKDKQKEKLTDIAEKDFPAPVARDSIGIPGSDTLKMKDLPPALPEDKKK